jgi:hypothetical protein
VIFLFSIDRFVSLNRRCVLVNRETEFLFTENATILGEVSETFAFIFLSFSFKFFIGARVIAGDPREDRILTEIIEASSAKLVDK